MVSVCTETVQSVMNSAECSEARAVGLITMWLGASHSAFLFLNFFIHKRVMT